MKKATVVFLLGLAVGLVGLRDACAVPFTATITADNHYAIYYGTDSNLTFVGRNELNAGGSPGTYNWSMAETFTFDVPAGQNIYVVGWSDDAVAQGWMGQFVSSSKTIYSDTSWEYLLTYNDLDDGADAPSPVDVQNKIAAHLPWLTPVTVNGYGWGDINGINPAADWIWGSSQNSNFGYGEYQVFRHSVPEPGTLLLLGAGLTGIAALRRKARR